MMTPETITELAAMMTGMAPPVPPEPAVADAAEAAAVVAFWRDAGPALWFAKDPAFDARFRTHFLPAYEAAAHGRRSGWLVAPQPALALVLLLDQYPRNAFRGTARMYATDAAARAVATRAIAAGFDRRVESALRLFFYLPYAHSESASDQARSVELADGLGEPALSHALGHRDIVLRFGRFPHRNGILGRPTTPAEADFLAAGGFAG